MRKSRKQKSEKSEEDFDIRNPSEYISKIFNSHINRLPRPLVIIISLFVALLLFFYLIYKDQIATNTREFISQQSNSLVAADKNKFSIVIAKLENDSENNYQKLIADALVNKFNKEDDIEIIVINKNIAENGSGKAQEMIKKGHEKAAALLSEMGASVMIWGAVLHEVSEKPLRLHWTTNSKHKIFSSSEKYLLTEKTYDLPDLFWKDLSYVLGLLAASQVNYLSENDGNNISSELFSFIKKVRTLVSSDQRFSKENKAVLQIILADSLSLYGKQKNKIEELRESVYVYKHVLSRNDLELSEFNIATIKNNLGVALFSLGGYEIDDQSFIESIDLLKDSLVEFKQIGLPFDWAIAADNLANSLSVLGEGNSNTSFLIEAIKIYQEVLTIRTRENSGLIWAKTHNNIGNAFRALGRLKTDSAGLKKAIEHYEFSLEKRTRAVAPFDWAVTQLNLGKAFELLGEKEKNKEYLKKSLSFYNKALEIFRREVFPSRWATAKNNLGSVLVKIGKLESNVFYYKEAAKNFDLALKEFSKQKMIKDQILIEYNIKNLEREKILILENKK